MMTTTDARREAALLRNHKVRRFLETGSRSYTAFMQWCDRQDYCVSDFDRDSFIAQCRQAAGTGVAS